MGTARFITHPDDQKALDGAAILSETLAVPHRVLPGLGEVDEGLASVPGAGSVAFVSHGGVGALLLCQLKGVAISRECEQPVSGPDAPKGVGGGYYFAFDMVSRAVLHGWEPLDATPSEAA